MAKYINLDNLKTFLKQLKEKYKATNDSFGGIKIGYAENGRNYPVKLDDNDKAYVNVPWTDTTPQASASTLGGIKLGYKKNDNEKKYPVELQDGKAYVQVPQTVNWKSIVKKGTWYRLCKVNVDEGTKHTGCKFLINIASHRTGVIYNDTFLITTHYSTSQKMYGSIIKLSGSGYSSGYSLRIVQIERTNSSTYYGDCWVEINDNLGNSDKDNIEIYCNLITIQAGAINTYSNQESSDDVSKSFELTTTTSNTQNICNDNKMQLKSTLPENKTLEKNTMYVLSGEVSIDGFEAPEKDDMATYSLFIANGKVVSIPEIYWANGQKPASNEGFYEVIINGMKVGDNTPIYTGTWSAYESK